MGAQRDRLMADIYEYIRKYGPVTSASIAHGLNDHYGGVLNSNQVGQLCRQLTGQDVIRLIVQNRGEAGTWEATA